MSKVKGPAAIYARISRDSEGEALGVRRQEQDCRALAKRLGLTVAEVFVDNDVSASTRSRKPRPAYAEMLRRADADEFGALLAYSTSRLTRRPMEYEALITLVEKRGVLIETVVSGRVDLTTADGRFVARTLASADAAEAERTGERVARASRQRAENGEWHGGWAPFGYEHAEVKGQLVVHPERAALVQEAARRITEGATLYEICTGWNARGLLTAPSARSKGSPWHPRTLKRLLLSPALVGMTELDGELHEAGWKPILDRRLWDRVRTILTDPARSTPDRGGFQSTTSKYLLSGLLVCGRCGKRLAQQPYGGQPTFICSTLLGGCGKLRINYAPVEERVVRFAMDRVNTPEVRRGLRQRTDSTEREGTLRRLIEDDERRLRQVEDDHYDGVLDRPSFLRQRDRLTRRITTSREELGRLTRPDAVGTLPRGREALHARWEEGDIFWQRRVLALVIDKVVIQPFPAGVAKTLTRRRSETEAAWLRRREDHLEAVLTERVTFGWRG